MGEFKPVSKNRAEQLKKYLTESKSTGKGLAFDKASGECLGTSSLRDAPDDKVNMISKYDIHFKRIRFLRGNLLLLSLFPETKLNK